MNKKIRIIKNSLLRQHEQIRRYHLRKLIREIKADGYIKDPIIADVNTMVILDGHHRFNALKFLGFASSPVYLC